MYKLHFFFTKLKPKIKGVAYPWIHLCLECSITSLMFIKLLKMPRNLRNWERVAVVHWLFRRSVAPKGAVCVFKCLLANLALQEFFQAINFCFTRTTKHQHMSNLLLFFTTFMANLLTALSGSCSSPTTLCFLFMARRWPGPGPDSSQHLKFGN